MSPHVAAPTRAGDNGQPWHQVSCARSPIGVRFVAWGTHPESVPAASNDQTTPVREPHMRLQSWILAALAAVQIGAVQAASADRLAAGGSLRQSEPITGDLIAAAGEIRVAAPVGGDAMLA